nr:rhomboid family intramembrane serine protease [uncultured Mucilaginibacter sp.]
MTFWDNIQYKINGLRSKLYLLIWINIIVFLVLNVPAVFEGHISQTQNILTFSDTYLALPSNLKELLKHFWTPFTYMFMHAGVRHILFNMLGLYWFGQIFEEFLGKKRTIGLYLLGGLSGAILFVIAFNLLPLFSYVKQVSYVVGASASVMAVVIGAATLVPHYEVNLILIGPIRIKWIALFYVVVDFLGTTGPNAGGEIAHLGGALIGFIYVKQLQRGNDWIENITGIFKRKSKLKVVSTNHDKRSSAKPRQEDVDAILDKISTTGYDSLTKQEKEILFRASKHEEEI